MSKKTAKGKQSSDSKGKGKGKVKQEAEDLLDATEDFEDQEQEDEESVTIPRQPARNRMIVGSDDEDDEDDEHDDDTPASFVAEVTDAGEADEQAGPTLAATIDSTRGKEHALSISLKTTERPAKRARLNDHGAAVRPPSASLLSNTLASIDPRPQSTLAITTPQQLPKTSAEQDQEVADDES